MERPRASWPRAPPDRALPGRALPGHTPHAMATRHEASDPVGSDEMRSCRAVETSGRVGSDGLDHSGGEMFTV